MGATLLTPGSCSSGGCYTCDCQCVLTGYIEEGEPCVANALVSLTYNCDGVATVLDLDEYEIMARVTGDDGILWEGPASELPSEFTGEVSETFTLEAWSELEGSHGVCSTIEAIERSVTLDSECKTCPTKTACECLDGDWVAVPDATITVSGTSVSKPITSGVCSPAPAPTCGDISGSYVSPCGVYWYGVYSSLICSGSGVFNYYLTKIIVTNSKSGVNVSMLSGLSSAGSARTFGTVYSGSGAGPVVGGGSQYESNRDAEIYECFTGPFVNIYRCSLGAQYDAAGTPPTANGCDVTGLTIVIAR